MATKNRRAPRLVLVILSALALCVSVLASPVAALPPTAPTVDPLTPTATTMKVDWSGAAPGAPANFVRYDVSIAPADAALQQFTNLSDATATFTGLTPNKSYTVTVTIVNDDGVANTASASQTASTLAAAPNAPSVTRAALGTTGVTVNWTNNNLNGSTVTNYTVSLTPSNGGVAPTPKTINAGTLTTTFTGLVPGNYVANVVTNSNNGPSPAGSAGSITIASPATTPATPTITSRSVSGGAVTVNFSVPTIAGNGAPESYRIRLFADDGSPTPVASAQPSNAQVGIGGADLNGSFTLSTTVSGQYRIDVASTNSAGTSGIDTSSGITVAIAPGPPTGVNASSNADKVTITWTAPNTTGGSIGSYEVVFDGKTTIVNAPTTTLTVSGVAAGTYTATVKAVNTVPLKSAAASSNSVTVIVAADAPTNVKGVATGQTVVVSWNAPANSGGSPVQSYKVTLNGVNKTVNGTIRTATFTNVPFGKHVATVVATTGVGAGATASSPTIDVKRAFEPFNTDEKFVEQLYRDILGRNADAGGRDYWAGLINGDPNKVSTVVEAFLNSPEFGPRRPIIRLYLAYFNRAPDAGGFDYWTNLYVGSTVSLLDASHLFSTSPEFSQTYGNLSNGQFVVLVYNNVLGRSPDVEGYNWWVNKLSQGLSRAGMMIEFSESAEFLKVSKNFVDITMVYRGMLIRIPKNPASTNEFNVWLPRLAGNETIDDLIMDIFNGDEYQARVTP